ncbi:DNA topoisomerase IB [Novosphingobium flavum]|uniref:DNA topoisomerase n=1 Tax=Novosphingobium flavum TaxID=1778672 RepID=A0A7X1FUV6_9SPHN|nr:DNA topoisomerase IB [Novosphingobium flavum]MBC2667401.1 DNA topoisomerase IB [Novosphingobium flavum]
MKRVPPHGQRQKRLRIVDDTMPGITRRRLKRAGRAAFAYYAPSGHRITDRAEIDRLNAVALPPAYEHAWFCPDPGGHLLATGIDARGRKQYRYHPAFRLTRESAKFDSTARFGRLLPRLRARVEHDLALTSLCRDRAIASVVRLLDTGAIRIGNEAYAKINRSFGATTLRMRHARLRGRVLRLSFAAKSGKAAELALTDPALLRFVRAMQDLPGQHLFQYMDDGGAACPVTSSDVNAWLREVMGEAVTAKQFRTWHASVLAFERLAGADGKVSLKALAAEVSDRLGNTPAVARKSYIHPAVLELVDQQVEWRVNLRLPRAARWLGRAERGLIALLEAGPKAQDLLAG